jgi:phage FluMu protein Com
MVTKKQTKQMLNVIEGKICPECHKAINSLFSDATATTGATMDEDGNISLDNEDLNDRVEYNEWRCPNCDYVIAWNSNDACKFLMGREND